MSRRVIPVIHPAQANPVGFLEAIGLTFIITLLRFRGSGVIAGFELLMD
jgi:hypothetical protein